MRGIRPARAGPGTLTSVLSLKGEEAGNSDPRKLLPSSLLLESSSNHSWPKLATDPGTRRVEVAAPRAVHYCCDVAWPEEDTGGVKTALGLARHHRHE